MEFIQVTNPGDARFAAAMELYVLAFPANERQPLPVVSERVQEGINQLYVNADISFMALLWPLTNTEFILLEYMATGETRRGEGIGSRFLQFLSKENNYYFLIEAEHPAYGSNKAERKARVAFYQKNGAKLLQDVRYVMPGLQGGEPTEMVLLVMPHRDINSALANALINRIYRELYNGTAG